MRNLFRVCVKVLITAMCIASVSALAGTVSKNKKTPATAAKSDAGAAQVKNASTSATSQPLKSQAEVSSVTPVDITVSDPNDYHIGSLDLLEIKVLQADEMARTVRVDARGNISLPLIGVVHVAGLTAYEAEQLVAAKLEADYIQNPQVSIFIKEFTSQRVTVQGVVKKSGLYDFQGQATLLQAISMGGGLDVKANESAIKVIRQQTDGTTQTLVYDLIAIRQNKAPNPTLKGGDIVVVEEADPITVEGAVMKAGVFYPTGDATLMQVISQAGGLSDLADSSSIKVFSSDNNDKKSAFEYDLEKIRDGKINDPVLHAGDVVVVERSAVRSVINSVTGTLRGFIGFGTIRY